MRALVVEDEFISRIVLEKMLAPIFEVDVVVNGAEALEAFELAHSEERPYRLILMDIMMPVKNGLEALEVIRQREDDRTLPRAKVIMTTALADIKTVVRAFDSGQASAYIVKPIDKDKLFRELKTLGLIDD
ncbi:response regulator [Desulfovibrio subterraneus]|jgi:two-component system chemotaxis response regulator CheY|uniref:Response regulator n=1 Tax=Desulfovibrio subterraneus TaxID=2718620 RepID=A0A7J0BHE0_9BACT|nr:response regulator [Desulfovibrio subterraneus]WBF66894.1 response regulator [Desulfovibrio subterraneus]GFM32621.1 response regulator [Desulfovibrio subterraneus]